MYTEKINKDVLIIGALTTAICWIIALWLSFFFVLVSKDILKFLSVMLLLSELVIGASAIWYLLTEAYSRENPTL